MQTRRVKASVIAVAILSLVPQTVFAQGQKYFLGSSEFSDGTVKSAGYVDLSTMVVFSKTESFVDTVLYFSPSAEKLGDMPELAGGRVEERDALRCDTAQYRKISFKVFDASGKQTYSNVQPTAWLPVPNQPLVSDIFDLICKSRLYPVVPDTTPLASHAMKLFKGEMKPPSAKVAP